MNDLLQKIFSRSLRGANYAVVHNLLNAEKYLTRPKVIFTFFLPTRFASAIWTGSTNAPALFLQSFRRFHRSSSCGVLQIHACIKRGKNLTDGITLLVGQMLFSSSFFWKKRSVEGLIKLRYSESMMSCPKFDLTYKRSGFEGSDIKYTRIYPSLMN